MQTPIDIPEAQVEALHTLSKARNQTPAEVLSGVLAQSPTPNSALKNLSVYGKTATSTALRLSAKSALSGIVNGIDEGALRHQHSHRPA